MAVNTVLHYGRVFPEERPTSLGVATQAILIHCGLPKLAWIGSAVRVMATRAGYFAFAVRHVRGALQLCSAHLVTPKAKFRLGFSETFVFSKRFVEASLVGQGRMQFLMRLVAIHASHSPRFVRAAPPEQLVSAGVALQASKVFLGYRVLGIFSKADRNRILGSACLDMHTTGAVTRFATASLVGRLRMRHCFSHCCAVEASALILVTGDTGIATDVIAIGFGVRRLELLCG